MGGRNALYLFMLIEQSDVLCNSRAPSHFHCSLLTESKEGARLKFAHLESNNISDRSEEC